MSPATPRLPRGPLPALALLAAFAGGLLPARLARGAQAEPGQAIGQQAVEGDAPPDRPAERADWNALWRRDTEGRVLARNRVKALEDACNLPVDASMRGPAPAAGREPSALARGAVRSARWHSLGPRPIQSVNGMWGNTAGRISALAIHPSDESILLVATATGGIWKSTDSGANWRPVSDGAAALAMSHVAFAPSNPSIAYAATGEVDAWGDEVVPRRSSGVYLGAGLLRSADGGETWSRVDVDLPENAVMSRVVVHPSDPQTVLVGIYQYVDVPTNSSPTGGTYRSTDGGVHFTRTFTHRVSDLAQDPGDPGRVYAGVGRCPDCAASGVYVSTDFGETWSPSLTSDNPVAGFASPTGRVRLGVTRAAGATILYASVLDASDQHTNAGIFRSGDGGATWARKNADSTMCAKPPDLNQCRYDHWIAPASGSATTLYFGGLGLYKSTDGAGTWTRIADPYVARPATPVPVHPDQHMGVASAVSADTVYFCNDGGLYRTTDGGRTFQNLNATLTLAQLNGVAFDPGRPDFAMGGTQDNGNLRWDGASTFTDRTGGDGGFNIIRSDRPSVFLSGYYYAYMTTSYDAGDDYLAVYPCDVLIDCTTGDPLEPMSFYPHVAAAPAVSTTVFFPTNRIWRHATFADNPNKWTPRASSSVLASPTDYFLSVAVTGDGSGILWAGSRDGELQFSTDGGATFSARNGGLPKGPISQIVLFSQDGRSAYVTFSGFLGAGTGHVFRTTDAGLTWSGISANLPDVPVVSMALDPGDGNDLFVGTDIGVFRSVDGGAHWATFNEGLPNNSVYGLAFHPTSHDLYAATYGRGLFRIQAPSLAPIADFNASSAVLSAGQPALFVDESGNSPTSWAWDFGDPGSGAANTSSLKNPHHTFSAAGIYTVSLTATNGLGTSRTSRTFTVETGGSCKRCPRLTPFR